MAEKFAIELDEAKRRVDAMLVKAGYQEVYGRWNNKYYNDEEKEPLWSTAITGFVNTRVLLWKEKDHWRGVVSVAVGKDGEMPICEGIIRRKQDKIFPPREKMQLKIMETLGMVYRWNTTPANTYSAQALARLTDWFLCNEKYRKAKQVNRALINGVINAATVSEALSIVQSTYAPSREERVHTALIWGEVYR